MTDRTDRAVGAFGTWVAVPDEGADTAASPRTYKVSPR